MIMECVGQTDMVTGELACCKKDVFVKAAVHKLTDL